MNNYSEIKNLYSRKNNLLARVIKKSFFETISNTEFFSDEKEILQCGAIVYKNDLKPKFHRHHKVVRNILGTSETLYVVSGNGTLEVFGEESDQVQKIEVSAGDLINLIDGAHRIIPKGKNNLIMIEVKNGPYVSRDADKIFIDK